MRTLRAASMWIAHCYSPCLRLGGQPLKVARSAGYASVNQEPKGRSPNEYW
ncbi:MAG: hypothetical protein ACAF41_23785 [Leptolyngbya sp. BL-A-14]